MHEAALQYQAKRLVGKNVYEMKYSVSSGQRRSQNVVKGQKGVWETGLGMEVPSGVQWQSPGGMWSEARDNSRKYD